MLKKARLLTPPTPGAPRRAFSQARPQHRSRLSCLRRHTFHISRFTSLESEARTLLADFFRILLGPRSPIQKICTQHVLDMNLHSALLVCGGMYAPDDRVQLCDGVVFTRAFRISAMVLASRPAAVNSLSVAAAMFARLPYCLSRPARLISPMPIT